MTRVAVIVAHPDDEILWCGGLLLSRPRWAVFVACLARGRDPDRAPRFRRVLERLGARGAMGDLEGAYLPRARTDATLHLPLPTGTWEEKRRLMREVYNYPESSWEVRSTPRSEAFHRSSPPAFEGPPPP